MTKKLQLLPHQQAILDGKGKLSIMPMRNQSRYGKSMIMRIMMVERAVAGEKVHLLAYSKGDEQYFDTLPEFTKTVDPWGDVLYTLPNGGEIRIDYINSNKPKPSGQ